MIKADTTYDKYDEVHEMASLGDKCSFCMILKKMDPEVKILYEDSLCVIISDYKRRATAHY